MSVAAALERGHAVADEDPSVLDRIMAEGVELAVWRRSRPTALAWLDALAWNTIDDLDFPIALSAIAHELAEGLAEAGYPAGGGTVALRDDIAAHARRFAAIIGCDSVRLRLEVVETDACRRFHADLVPARLLTTLVGPGTQWIEAGLPEQIHQLAAGDVAIFKGLRWVEEPVILHRSPPVTATGDTRLLLAIDPFDPHQDDAHG